MRSSGGAGAWPRIPRPMSTICRPALAISIGWCQQTRGGRRRASAAATYLKPASKRPNLQIVTARMVHRVLFDGNARDRGGVLAAVRARDAPMQRAR